MPSSAGIAEKCTVCNSRPYFAAISEAMLASFLRAISTACLVFVISVSEFSEVNNYEGLREVVYSVLHKKIKVKIELIDVNLLFSISDLSGRSVNRTFCHSSRVRTGF